MPDRSQWHGKLAVFIVDPANSFLSDTESIKGLA
jgi:hypothetical protein